MKKFGGSNKNVVDSSSSMMTMTCNSKLVRNIFALKWKKVKQMLKTKACIEQVQRTNNFVLSIAVSHNPPVEIVQTLLEISPSHSLMVDSYGMLPLNIASMNGASSAIIKLLLEHDDGASAQAIDIFKRTPLHYAVQFVCEPESMGNSAGSAGSGSTKKSASNKNNRSRNASSHSSQLSMSQDLFQDQILVIQLLVQAEPELVCCADKENRTPIDILQDCKATYKEGSKWERADIICEMLRKISTKVYREKKILCEMQGYNYKNYSNTVSISTASSTAPSYCSHHSGGNSSANSNFSNMEVDCTSYNQMDVSLGSASKGREHEHQYHDPPPHHRRHVRLKMMKGHPEEDTDMDVEMM